MMDLLAAKWTLEILKFINDQKNPIKITKINSYFQKRQVEVKTTATIYRRVKELHLAGILMRDSENRIYLTDFGKKNLAEIKKQEIRLKKSRRAILQKIPTRKSISRSELQTKGFSPVTIQKSMVELQNLDLVEQVVKKPEKVGRPEKQFKLTKKGLRILRKHSELEEKISK